MSSPKQYRVFDRKGLCVRCGGKRAKGSKSCAVCLKKLRAYAATKRDEKRRARAAVEIERKVKPAPRQMPLPIGNVRTARKLSDIPERFMRDLGTREYRAHLATFSPRTKPFTRAEIEADRIEEMLALSQLRISYLSRSP